MSLESPGPRASLHVPWNRGMHRCVYRSVSHQNGFSQCVVMSYATEREKDSTITWPSAFPFSEDDYGKSPESHCPGLQ